MTTKIELHPDDERELFRLRAMLTGWRVASNLTQQEASQRANLGNGGLWGLEAGARGSTRLSRLQSWARGFDLRLEPGLEWLPEVDDEFDYGAEATANADSETHAMWMMAQREFEADTWLRMWLVSALRALRVEQGYSRAHVAGVLGVTRGAVAIRESHKNEPLIHQLMQLARVLNVRVRLRLVERCDWSAPE